MPSIAQPLHRMSDRSDLSDGVDREHLFRSDRGQIVSDQSDRPTARPPPKDVDRRAPKAGSIITSTHDVAFHGIDPRPLAHLILGHTFLEVSTIPRH